MYMVVCKEVNATELLWTSQLEQINPIRRIQGNASRSGPRWQQLVERDVEVVFGSGVTNSDGGIHDVDGHPRGTEAGHGHPCSRAGECVQHIRRLLPHRLLLLGHLNHDVPRFLQFQLPGGRLLQGAPHKALCRPGISLSLLGCYAGILLRRSLS